MGFRTGYAQELGYKRDSSVVQGIHTTVGEYHRVIYTQNENDFRYKRDALAPDGRR